MRITHEADYAIRIVYLLATLPEGGRMGAGTIAEQSSISPRFTLKILRKLMIAGLVISYKGVNGGYALSRRPSEISVGEVIELINGPILLNHCLDAEYACSRSPIKSECRFHKLFCKMNASLRSALFKETFDTFLEDDDSNLK